MKPLTIILVLFAVLATAAFADDSESLFKIGGVTDGYIIAGKDGGTLTAGQDVNVDIGPFFLDLTFDWTKTLWDGDNIFAPAYAVGFCQTFGAFTPSIKLTGDHSYSLDNKEWTGDWFSDLEPQLGVVFGNVGADLYSDLSFEAGYAVLQTIDGSAFFNLGPACFRAGVLYMDAQAVTDDVGYPNAPAAREGVSGYFKVSVTY